MSFTHIDCFSGPGGICTGLCAAGFDTIVAIEYIKSCVDTYSANHPSVHMIHSDIRAVTSDDILPYVPSDGVDLVTSGMPCETFSTAGNTSRSFYDDRQFLFREGIRIAKIARAKLLLFENVPGITTKTVEKKSNALIVDLLKKELIEAGYGNYIEVVLSADKFGVPQRRNRFFILASSNPDIKLSYPIPKKCKMTTVKDAFAGLPNVIPNSGKEEKQYTGTESDYSLLLKNDSFWKRVSKSNNLTYQMIKENRLANTAEDIAGLRSWAKDFDLYAIQAVHGETHVFGCIQSKTSIRDRVGRDVTFSRNAMEGLFWSAAVTLDGAFLNMPEFIHMVNGGGSYSSNGWHGMYAMSGIQESNGRIYKVDDSLNLFVAHAISAARQFISDRRMLNHEWNA